MIALGHAPGKYEEEKKGEEGQDEGNRPIYTRPRGAVHERRKFSVFVHSPTGTEHVIRLCGEDCSRGRWREGLGVARDDSALSVAQMMERRAPLGHQQMEPLL